MPETGNISEVPRYDPSTATVRTVNRELGKSEFLKLFVTRLRYQDPMSPVQDEEFIAQLAQFSSLEQLTNINDALSSGMGLSDQLAPLSTLDSINDRLAQNQEYSLILAQSINNTMAAALIDRVVTWQPETVTLGASGDIELHYRLTEPTRAVVARVIDSQGQQVRALSLGALAEGDHALVWDGKNTAGERLPAGNYRIELAAVGADGSSRAVALTQKGRVDGVRYVDGLAYLDVSGVLVALADVQELRSE